ncbi:MAG TPA: 5-(carboxyamino)imidazole ribonucleotide mutase [Gaiellaceae bacterium]
MSDGAVVGVLVGSESDRERMQPALDELDGRGIGWEFEVRSAHRDPDGVAEYCRAARARGLKVLICGAGLAAALPGVAAAHTDLPVIGVPLRSSMSVLDGLDALLSIVQMPPGVPVACVGVDNAKNAAALAARILGA